MLTATELRALSQRFASAPAAEVLNWAWERFGRRAALGTSFQGAGLVLLHLARQMKLDFPAFTLDTGLLFPETVELKRRLEQALGLAIESVQPDLTVEQQTEAQGPELWKTDPDLCCTLRKVLPLQSKLADLDCWITGLRRQQSSTRSDTDVVELYELDANAGRAIVKLNPLAHWSREQVWDYVRQHHLPSNPLRDQGYQSIGCRPCTRPIASGENERAGRWVGFKKVECGIHTFMSKKIDFQI